jgi:hypothetical protein
LHTTPRSAQWREDNVVSLEVRMELVVAALAAGTVAWMWRHRVMSGSADPYMVWILRYTDREAYRTF